jgi:hypothetical protein
MHEEEDDGSLPTIDIFVDGVAAKVLRKPNTDAPFSTRASGPIPGGWDQWFASD